jgi:ABC-type multidrug transport system fused ATPase/permease subunit
VYAIILLSTAVTVSMQLYEFVAFAAALLFVTWIMLRLYLPTATKIKSLVSDTSGSLVGLTAEALEGLEVIQAYQHEDYFVRVSLSSSPIPSL